MYERYIKNNVFTVTIVLVIVCFAAWTCPAYADSMTGSLTICYVVNDNGSEIQIDGAEFSIYNVEDPILSPRQVMSAEDVDKIAEELSEKDLDVLMTGVTDKKGNLVFHDLEKGVYLVKQTGKTRGSAAYDTARPFLVSIPSEEGYGLICYPKTSLLKNSEPETGDMTGLTGALLTFVTGVILLAGIVLSSKEERRDGR